MKLRIHRTDGRTGAYSQTVKTRAKTLIDRLDPMTLFERGPIVIGVVNPFSVLNPDEVCWIELQTDEPVRRRLPQYIDTVTRLRDREEYEALLAQQWPRWRKYRKGEPGDLFEAMVELSLRSGESLYLRLSGRVGPVDLVGEVFSRGALCASFAPNGTVYINPKCVVRARIYHSRDRVDVPNGLWVAEADDI